MALDRIDGKEDLYVGGVFGLMQSRLDERGITHILSVIKYTLGGTENHVNENGVLDQLYGRRLDPRKFTHLSIDIDDMDDQDILMHFPRMVRFIERGLYGAAAFGDTIDGSITPASNPAPNATGAVYVHCAMGRSRSVSAIIAYLLWKYPARFGRSDPTTTSQNAVANALVWVQRTRGVAQPNSGFMEQLALWWEMGCPADGEEDAVERHPVYQRWLYKREVEEAARIGRVPDWLRFEDEVETEKTDEKSLSVRCKKCRKTLATGAFVVPHQGTANGTEGAAGQAKSQPCPHVFVEPLAWMRPALEGGALDGRLVCPNAKCGASVGRFSWQGFKCSCGEWVCPAFSLQKSKVDEVVSRTASSSQAAAADPAKAAADRMAAMRITGLARAAAKAAAQVGGRRENRESL